MPNLMRMLWRLCRAGLNLDQVCSSRHALLLRQKRQQFPSSLPIAAWQTEPSATSTTCTCPGGETTLCLPLEELPELTVFYGNVVLPSC